MPKPIEVVAFSDVDSLERLSVATWNNDEPGFQIDDVQTIQALFDVFDIVRKSAPKDRARNVEFNSVYPENPDFDKMSAQYSPNPGDAHLDGPGKGMAIHQNITDTVVVRLGFPKKSFTSYRPSGLNIRTASKIRVGQTVPGRLTVFSEGGYSWLLPTAHQFGRTHQTGNEWVRYVQGYRPSASPEGLLRKVAIAALARIAERTQRS